MIQWLQPVMYLLHVSHDSNPHNCQVKCVKETACFCYPIKSTRRTAHANFRASGSASKLSKDACLLAGYSCTSGLENKHWISAFPIQTLLQPVAKVLETLPYFGLNGLPMILFLWSPLLPLSKMLAIQDHAQNMEEQLWMEGRREVSIILHSSGTSRDFKSKRPVFHWSVSTFLHLVVAQVCCFLV